MNTPSSRLVGLDFARFFAFFGMLLINFNMTINADQFGSPLATQFVLLFEGRASATFVMLAGLGLGLMWQKSPSLKTKTRIFKRAMVLLVFGLLNFSLFLADILHFYAIYFLIVLLVINHSTKRLWLYIGLINLVAFILLFTFNYEANWNFKTFEYTNLWTVQGFVSNLLFNGIHPVFPWASFVLLGLILSRLDLNCRKTQLKYLKTALIVQIVAQIYTQLHHSIFTVFLPEDVATLLATEPMPATLFYMIASSSFAVLAIMLCLYTAPLVAHFWLYKKTVVAGQQALTLYILHIFIGLVLLESIFVDMDGSYNDTIVASAIFTLFALVFSNIWAWLFGQGLFERILRKLSS